MAALGGLGDFGALGPGIPGQHFGFDQQEELVQRETENRQGDHRGVHLRDEEGALCVEKVEADAAVAPRLPPR